jgi:hypothetical protein
MRDTIDMAREAGIIHPEMVAKHLEAFAKLVAQHEREACAQLAQDNSDWYGDVATIADLIRARGNT